MTMSSFFLVNNCPFNIASLLNFEAPQKPEWFIAKKAAAPGWDGCDEAETEGDGHMGCINTGMYKP